MTTQRVTIPVAAQQLGVSEVTVRRRIKSGDLEANKEKTAQGYRWLIMLDTPANEPEPADHDPDQTSDHQVIMTTHVDDQHLLDELNNRIAFLETQLDDAKRSHDRDRDGWDEERSARIREIEREQELLAREQQIVQSLAQRIESLTAGPINQERSTHKAVGSPESVATSDDESGHRGDVQAGGGTVWQRLGRWIRGA